MGGRRLSAVALRPVAPTPLADSLPRLERLVSPLSGIVRRIYEPLPTPDEPALRRIAAEATDGDALLGAPLVHLAEGTGGAAPLRDAALAAAIGEAVERYSAAYVPEERLVRASARRLGAAVPPDRFALFAEHQYRDSSFPFRPFTADTEVSWVEAFSIPDGEAAYLPAQLVYLRDPRRGLAEPPIGYATSNGLACGPTLEEAVLAGLLEAIERDAFLLTWYGRLSLPLLDWSRHPDLTALDRRYFARTRRRYAVADLSCFHGVPTALALVRGTPPAAALAVGAGCAATIEDAWLKSLAEAFAVAAWARALAVRAPERTFAPDFSDVVSFADHVHFYADARRAQRADFLDASGMHRPIDSVERVGGDDVRALIVSLAARLEAVDEPVYAVDVTSPDIRDAGLAVAKVIVPGFCQLDVAYRYRFLGSKRLSTAAWRLGLRDRPLTPRELNPDPHPFP